MSTVLVLEELDVIINLLPLEFLALIMNDPLVDNIWHGLCPVGKAMTVERVDHVLGAVKRNNRNRS